MNQTAESSTLRRPPLPQRYVDRIFAALQGNYGSRFLNQWKTGQVKDGMDVGVLNAKGVWAEKLGGFVDQPERIRIVLENLPNDPPSLPEFISLCRQAHTPTFAALTYTPSAEDKRRNAENAERLQKQVANLGDRDQYAWARRPKSAQTLAAVIAGAKSNKDLAGIFATLVAEGVATEQGKLLQRWDGTKWVKP